jgi:MarR family transcriptional regulator, transcriptional regulator for hemolysin
MRKFHAQSFGPLLGGTARAWRLKLDQRLKPMGLSQARWRTLLHLARAEQPLTQSQIAARLGVEEPTLATLLHRLEAEGWVMRKTASHDRRCKTVHLQRRAQRVIDRINTTALKLRRELTEDIPPHDMQVCMRVLARVRERIDRAPASNGSKGKRR